MAVGVLLLDLPGTRPYDLLDASVVLRNRPSRARARRQRRRHDGERDRDDQGERYLYTDDFAAAATGRHYRYMRMLGHLPAVLARNRGASW